MRQRLADIVQQRGQPEHRDAPAVADFLKSGGSRYPLDAMRMAGVDLASAEPVEQAFAMLADLVERLDKLV